MVLCTATFAHTYHIQSVHRKQPTKKTILWLAYCGLIRLQEVIDSMTLLLSVIGKLCNFYEITSGKKKQQQQQH